MPRRVFSGMNEETEDGRRELRAADAAIFRQGSLVDRTKLRKSEIDTFVKEDSSNKRGAPSRIGVFERFPGLGGVA